MADQRYPEPTVGALILNPRGEIFLMRSHIIFFDYVCRTDSFQVTLNDEGQAYVWVPAEEALALPVEPYTVRTIEAYIEAAGGHLPPPGDRSHAGFGCDPVAGTRSL
jgi:hypothetical protein